MVDSARICLLAGKKRGSFYRWAIFEIIKMESFLNWLQDILLAILDEIKFWGEVFSAFMEWDEEGRQKYIKRQMDLVKEEMEAIEKGVVEPPHLRMGRKRD